MKHHLARGCAVAAVLAIAGIAATAAPGAIRIAKIYYDSPGADTGSNKSLNAEWNQAKEHRKQVPVTH